MIFNEIPTDFLLLNLSLTGKQSCAKKFLSDEKRFRLYSGLSGNSCSQISQ